jgi:hypothetical protein
MLTLPAIRNAEKWERRKREGERREEGGKRKLSAQKRRLIALAVTRIAGLAIIGGDAATSC